MMPVIGRAVLADTDATFDNEPKTIEERVKWFVEHGVRNPIVVAEVNGNVVGWASPRKWSTRCAYTETAEISLYVKESYCNQGIGKNLMQAVLNEGKKVGLHTVISRIACGNDVSIHLHRQFGFTGIGVMREVGKKFGKLLDVLMMQKIY